MPSSELLILAAQETRRRAYTPYSGYKVGAALETDSGAIVRGCNVENLSYGATICAERTAVTKMIADGMGSKIVALAVASKDGVTPCGICLQVLSEFVEGPGTPVYRVNEAGEVQSMTFSELLPHAFVSNEVGRTESESPAV